ncbi:hypothetical protein NOJ05_01265 [Neorhizobium galegae]|uniref:hypothetical protein n=1 Tax=Neorhizobium galegae TaxID=399 RepID=UPI002102AABF|nr:hypothetical protein [Neorhizobium galegae]MCQ1775827.1 hypothetical protein [Neorhizobium galegae]MCQ1797998.1 hypothetical protein [Neorhizobium galegae]
MTNRLLMIITTLVSLSVISPVLADEGDYYDGVNRDLGVSVHRLATSSISNEKKSHGFVHNGGGRDNNWPVFLNQSNNQGIRRPN